MNNIDIEVPADARTVTLALGKGGGAPTLLGLLPYIMDQVELRIVDQFDKSDYDVVYISGRNGNDLASKLRRSRVVDGERLLRLVPNIKVKEPHPRLINGSSCLDDNSVIVLAVRWDADEGE